jgi:NAD(P)H-flavin reductase
MIDGAPTSDAWRVRSMQIASIHPEIDGVATYDLTYANGVAKADYTFRPGQFNMLYLPGVGESAISLSGPTHEATAWQHTVRVAGRVTQTLAQLRVGQQIGVRGPFGYGWPIDQWRGSDVVLVAGGIGLAPIRPVVYELLRRRTEYGRLTLIYGARDPRSLLFAGEFSQWESHGLRVLATVDRATPDWQGRLGVVTLLMDSMAMPGPQATVVAICGPEVMIRYAALSAEKRRVSSTKIWVSLERNMSCAVGLCGHCQLGPEFICKDGPVLRYDRVQTLLNVEAL